MASSKDVAMDVKILIGSSDALEPALGESVAQQVLAASSSEVRVVLDFSKVSVISSAFANAFFLAIAKERHFDQLPETMDFIQMKPRIGDVWLKSFKAVRHDIQHPSTTTER